MAFLFHVWIHAWPKNSSRSYRGIHCGVRVPAGEDTNYLCADSTGKQIHAFEMRIVWQRPYSGECNGFPSELEVNQLIE